MSGIEKILAAIGENGNAEVSRIKAQADKQIALISERALHDSEAAKNKIAEDTAALCRQNLETAAASAKAAVNRAILSAKVAAVNEVIDEAVNRILALPADRYFEVLAGRISACAEKGEGLVCFAEKDLARLPAGFEAELNAKLKDGATLKVCSTPADIKDGFLLKYNDIEINGSMEAVKEAGGDRIRDAVAAVLFSK